MKTDLKRNELLPSHLYNRIEACLLEGSPQTAADSIIREFKVSEVEMVFQILLERISELEHNQATTIGLWATDRPDLVEDPKKILFQIK